MRPLFKILFLIVIANICAAQTKNELSPMVAKDSTKITYIDPLSTISLYIETSKNFFGKSYTTSSATGFIYQDSISQYLVTNWHVMTCRNPRDSSANNIEVLNNQGQKIKLDISDPDSLIIYFHKKKLGTWFPIKISLKNNGQRKWLEHPLGKQIDVIALKLELTNEQSDSIEIYSLKKEEYSDDMILYPSINLSIIGFPFGFSSYGRFPIWKTGQLASDFDLNYDNLPVFLIDATTRSGMSGSPVIIKQTGTSLTRNAFQVGGHSQKFLGIYSGRLPNDSDIGIVWKAICIDEIIKTGTNRVDG